MKTLKDAGFIPRCSVLDTVMFKAMMVEHHEELREVAKEWVKELEFRQAYNEIESQPKNTLLNSIDFIKHFFNLEGDDEK